MSITPSFWQAVDRAIDRKIRTLYVAGPARVESYDRTQQRVSIQPLIEQEYTDERGERQTERLPVIQGVPVVFPGILFDLTKGDTVLFVCSTNSIDKWLVTGGIVDPLDDRFQDFNDAMAIPGLNSFKSPSAQVAEGAHVLPGDDIRLGSKDASEFLALKSDVAALKSVFDTHYHQDPASGVTGTPVSGVAPGAPVTFPSPIGTTKVKAE